MDKKIFYGFVPVNKVFQRSTAETKGKKSFESKHVYDVCEMKIADLEVPTIVAKVIPQTKVNNDAYRLSIR